MRQYAPIENRPNKTVSSVSPVRYKSVAGNFANTLNRFKVMAKQDEQRDEKSPINKPEAQKTSASVQQIPSEGVRNKFSAGHYRTQSQ